MDVSQHIPTLEARLAARRISVAKLCRSADLAPTTWLRWKAGATAQRQSWQRVVEALQRLGVEAPEAPGREAA